MNNLEFSARNPFLSTVRLTVFKSVKTLTTYEEGNINKVVSTTSQEIEWEKASFTKVYNDSSIINLYKELTPTACKLVIFIQLNLPKNIDIIDLRSNVCMEFLGVSKATYYKSLQELIDNAIVTKYKTNTYWINPVLIFNGDRIKYYKDKFPECVDTINITEIQESKSIKKKKDIMKHFKCENYYQLKQLLGNTQIQSLLDNTLTLAQVKLLK
jgi:hypothetical protein